jgi:hypothetical protein
VASITFLSASTECTTELSITLLLLSLLLFADSFSQMDQKVFHSPVWNKKVFHCHVWNKKVFHCHSWNKKVMYGPKKCSIVPYGPKQYSIVLITSQSIWNKSYKFIARGLMTERIFSLVFVRFDLFWDVFILQF